MDDVERLNATIERLTMEVLRQGEMIRHLLDREVVDHAARSMCFELMSSKASDEHTHEMGDITGLESALSGKADTSHTHAYGDLTSIPSTFAPSVHGTSAHSGSDAVTWTQVGSKPTTFAPETHGSGSHDASVPTATEISSMKSVYNSHYHDFNVEEYDAPSLGPADDSTSSPTGSM